MASLQDFRFEESLGHAVRAALQLPSEARFEALQQALHEYSKAAGRRELNPQDGLSGLSGASSRPLPFAVPALSIPHAGTVPPMEVVVAATEATRGTKRSRRDSSGGEEENREPAPCAKRRRVGEGSTTRAVPSIWDSDQRASLAQSFWKCNVCNVTRNPIAKSECESCKAPRPDEAEHVAAVDNALPPAEDLPLTGAITKNGFVFAPAIPVQRFSFAALPAAPMAASLAAPAPHFGPSTASLPSTTATFGGTGIVDDERKPPAQRESSLAVTARRRVKTKDPTKRRRSMRTRSTGLED